MELLMNAELYLEGKCRGLFLSYSSGIRLEKK
jgi:hypothetical protein